MAVRLRLTRIGKHKVPYYRIVAVDSRQARDGEALEILGTYDALKSSLVTFDAAGIQKWISYGAQMSDSVKKICRLAKKQGFDAGAAATVKKPALGAEVAVAV